MEFTDIEEAHPDSNGACEVLIENADSGDQRKAFANFISDSGTWQFLSTRLNEVEYIKAWRSI